LPVETSSFFAQAIQEHLELKQRNSTLEPQMPLDAYKNEDPFENHPLFKTEEQARLEETLGDGEASVTVEHAPVPALAWPGDGDSSGDRSNGEEPGASLEDSLWGQASRDFDWGD
jgi:hypothetical protein